MNNLFMHNLLFLDSVKIIKNIRKSKKSLDISKKGKKK